MAALQWINLLLTTAATEFRTTESFARKSYSTFSFISQSCLTWSRSTWQPHIVCLSQPLVRDQITARTFNCSNVQMFANGFMWLNGSQCGIKPSIKLTSIWSSNRSLFFFISFARPSSTKHSQISVECVSVQNNNKSSKSRPMDD